MAILKHIASKNADYGETERYLIFQHDEYTQKPILDENGNMLLREEYYLDGNAKVASLPLAEYVRKQITNKKVIVKYEIVADLPELKKLIAEFGKIGSNLNQIARYFNTGGLHSQEMRNEIKKSITEIYKLKYEVIKLAGDFITVNANNRNSAGEN